MSVSASDAAERTLRLLAKTPNRELEARANAVRTFAGFLRSAPRLSEGLRSVASGALNAYANIPSLGANLLLRALFMFARQADATPPVALLTSVDVEPSEVLGGVATAGWSRYAFAGDSLWAPDWADELTRHGFLGGVVICDRGDDYALLARRIDELRPWRLPTVIACSSKDLARSVFEEGVTPLPEPTAELAYSWLNNRLTDHTAVSISLDESADRMALVPLR